MNEQMLVVGIVVLLIAIVGVGGWRCSLHPWREEAEKPISVTERDLASAFTEWERRFREEPERFTSESVRLLKSSPETYGEECAPYLLEIIEEQRAIRAEFEAKYSQPCS